MVKKKRSLREKELRKQLEILKAQVDTGIEVRRSKKRKVDELDINKIKKDLLKTVIFTAISLIFLILLYHLDISTNDLQKVWDLIKTKV